LLPLVNAEAMRFALLAILALPALAVETHRYCWGFLNAHPERGEMPEARIQEIQKGHIAHLNRLASEGHLLAAGPLATPGGARGIVVFRCQSAAEAAARAETDPAVVNKRLAIEMYNWRATGVWGEPLASKMKADPGYKYEMVQLPFAALTATRKAEEAGRIPAEALEQHLKYSTTLLEGGRLRSFGLFVNATGKLGILVYASMKPQEASELAAADPLVKDGWAATPVSMWYVATESVPFN
jgi:uncharacterized protein YciI